jgi:hypothetical protein
MKKSYFKISLSLFTALLPIDGRTEEIATDGAPPTEEVLAISQDVANTMTPDYVAPSDLDNTGVLRLDRTEDSAVMVFKSGVFSDKVDLLLGDSGCWEGDGLAAHISFCSEKEALFSVRGGPTLTCKHHSGVFFGPCEIESES